MRTRFGLKHACLAAAAATMLGPPAQSRAADLYTTDSWPALASDHNAAQVGDSLTVLIYETSTASNSTQDDAYFNGRLSGQVVTPNSSRTGQFTAGTGVDYGGRTNRTGSMVAQISVVVDGVLPNGDLHVAGEQFLKINGERTHIRLKGRVRRSDISPANTILSTRLADVSIDYDGQGFKNRRASSGRGWNIFRWLGFR